MNNLNLLKSILDLGVLALFSFMFVGYALFIYPVEILNQLVDPEVKQKRVKYAPQID
ncbi:hypothetical protein GH741_08945 [Aquibacillus halophilus]|uniref:Uncharacterized protein n=1 Tax=Aquibacillus halophilus TaxID=930132 RepID=A0A6A8DBZ1_9BACI|nr:hypothetical protein [Aquibacillus halophilus]MRH42810.1 hypothetical protein [Aquibacillus halophilus]